MPTPLLLNLHTMAHQRGCPRAYHSRTVGHRFATKVTVIVLGVLLAAFAIAWALEPFLSARQGEWSQAITLTATLALVVITAAYAVPPAILVRLQRYPIAAVRVETHE